MKVVLFILAILVVLYVFADLMLHLSRRGSLWSFLKKYLVKMIDLIVSQA